MMLLLLQRLARLPCPRLSLPPTAPVRPFTSAPAALAKALPPRPKPPPDDEIEESYLKGSGPGGQKINKTNSAVQLRHIPTGIVVKSQGTRSRTQNRKLARESLAQKVDDLLRGDQSRSAHVADVKRRRAASAAKKSRRKYRKLDEDKEAAEEATADGEEQSSKQQGGGGECGSSADGTNTPSPDSTAHVDKKS